MDETTRARSTRVLVVDYNAALAENIAEILWFEGYETAVAANGEQALPMALANSLAFVVTDYRLPGIDGAELVDRVLRAGKKVCCVVMSGETDDVTVSRAREAGARFFPKPVEIVALTRFMRDGEGKA